MKGYASGRAGFSLQPGLRPRSGCPVEQALACNGGFSPCPAFPGTGPSVVPRSGGQPCYNRVVLDITDGLRHLLRVPHPAVVGLGLPERSASLPDEQIGFASGAPLESSNQLACFDERSGEEVDVVGHYHPSVQFAETTRFRRDDFSGDEIRDVRLAQPHRSFTSRVEIPVHPDKSLTCGRMIRRRVAALRQASIQAPGHEQRAFLGMPVGQAAGSHHVNWCIDCRKVLKLVFGGAGSSLQRGLQPPSGPGLKPRLQAKAHSTRRLQAKACSTRR
jgi:hypothetical protein